MTGPTVRDAKTATFRLLIGLGSPNGHDQSLADDFDVGPFQRHQFGAAEAPSEAKQKQRPVALIAQCFPQAIQHKQQVIAHQWLGLPLGGAVLAAQAA